MKLTKEQAIKYLENNRAGFQGLPQYLREDEDVMQAAISQDNPNLQFALSAYKNNKKIMLAAITKYPDKHILLLASHSLQQDRNFILQLMTLQGAVLEDVLENFKNDREIVLTAIKQNGYAMQYASQELRNDEEFWLEAVKQNGNVLSHTSQRGRNIEKIVLAAVGQSGDSLRYASKDLRNQKDIVQTAVTQNGSALEYAAEAFQNDLDTVLLAVTQNGKAFFFASKELQKNPSVVLAAVTQCGEILKSTDEKFRNDKEIVLRAVSQNGKMFDYASPTLKQDNTIALTAVTQYGQAIEFLPDNLKNDRDIVRAAVQQDSSILRQLSDTYKNDQEIVHLAVQQNGRTLQYASQKLRDDENTVKLAMQNYGAAFKFASLRLQWDKNIILLAVEKSPSLFEDLPENFKKDKEIVLATVCANGNQIKYAPPTLQQDPDVILTALKKNHDAIHYAATFHSQEFAKDKPFSAVIIDYKSDGIEIKPHKLKFLVKENQREEAQKILTAAGIPFKRISWDMIFSRIGTLGSIITHWHRINQLGKFCLVCHAPENSRNAEDCMNKMTDFLQGKIPCKKKRLPRLSQAEILQRIKDYPQFHRNLDTLQLETPLLKHKPQPPKPHSFIHTGFIDTHESSLFEVIKHTLTLGEYVDMVVNGPGGYYDSGKIKFSSEQRKGHYHTFSTAGYGLAMMLARHAIELWQKMLDNGELTKTEFFKIVECGAGDGFLCRDMLSYMAELSKQNKTWKEFFAVLEYHIIEKSTALRKRQEIIASELKKTLGKKVKVHAGDALALEKSEFAKTEPDGCSLFFSNELVDMFPFYKQRIDPVSGEIQIALSLIGITAHDLRKNFVLSEKEFLDIKKRSRLYRSHLERTQKISKDINLLWLPKSVFSELFKLYSDIRYKGSHNIFEGQDIYVDAKYYPEYQTFLEKHYDAVSHLEKGDTLLVMPGIDQFVEGTKKICHGEILTLDYGKRTSYQLTNSSIRLYTDKECVDIYSDPGSTDITIDVNFSLLSDTVHPISVLDKEHIEEAGPFLKHQDRLWGKIDINTSLYFFASNRGSPKTPHKTIPPQLNKNKI